jgi:hypothetical protein
MPGEAHDVRSMVRPVPSFWGRMVHLSEPNPSQGFRMVGRYVDHRGLDTLRGFPNRPARAARVEIHHGPRGVRSIAATLASELLQVIVPLEKEAEPPGGTFRHSPLRMLRR